MTLPDPDPAFHWSAEPWGYALRCRPLGEVAQHLFASRQLALPDPDRWRDALASIDASPGRLMRVRQVHGNSVRIVKEGVEYSSEARPDGDAVISNVAATALAVMVADCVPILLADRRRGAAAAIHAGWRGTCAGVVTAAVAAMQREFGTRPEEVVAAIGPSAGPREYEVGEALVDAFRQSNHDQFRLDRWFIRTGGKLRLDLWAANSDQLTAAGVRPGHIHVCGLSTLAHPEIFDSYRMSGERAGRMAAIIKVPPPAASVALPDYQAIR
ncbi:MAG TPA: peptidoglycan editing factor PgeF [Vicinamibacterales bacterium]|nr:peptidoglycan editing factor PgeF [Vicinamibacterales bacterium]